MSRRRKIVRIVICALVFAACLFLALTIGDTDYNATLIGWLPLFSFIFVIGIAYVYIRVAASSLQYLERSKDARCTRGEKIPFAIDFENKGFLVLLNVQAELFVADAAGDVAKSTVTTFSLGPHKTCSVPFDVPFDHIGVFSAGLKEIVITDFLGLFQRRIVAEKQSLICVMPNVPQLGKMEFSDDSDVENFKMLKTALADSLDYAYVRDYEPGDPLKTIHWKLSARTGDYLTRLFEKTISPGVVVLIDFYCPGADVDESMALRDAVIESALSVADFAKSKGMDTDIRYTNRFGENMVMGTWNDEAVLKLVREMPGSVSDPDLEEKTLKHLQELAMNNRLQNNIVICSANVDEKLVGTVIASKQLRKNPFLVSVIPHRLVDRDREKHVSNLASLDAYSIGNCIITASDELSGREV